MNKKERNKAVSGYKRNIFKKFHVVNSFFNSILPVQDNPSPVNPAIHVQVKEPMVF